MWGSNVPVTRTPDAHFMAEARYRGQKVVTVSPDYTDNTKFADEWVAPHPGTDAALALAMGHVILKEHFVDKRTARFEDYMRRYTDAPYLSRTTRRVESTTFLASIARRTGTSATRRSSDLRRHRASTPPSFTSLPTRGCAGES
jgi:nitrate reductase alpha subunit